MEWIKCSDKMPEQDHDVLILTAWGGMYVAALMVYYGSLTWDTGDDDPAALGDVTHWAELPPPPRDSGAAQPDGQ